MGAGGQGTIPGAWGAIPGGPYDSKGDPCAISGDQYSIRGDLLGIPVHRNGVTGERFGIPVDRNSLVGDRNGVPGDWFGVSVHRNGGRGAWNGVGVGPEGTLVDPDHGRGARHAGPLAPKTGLAAAFLLLLPFFTLEMNRIKKLLSDYSFKRVSEISAFGHAVSGSTQKSSLIPNGKALTELLEKELELLDAFVEANPQLTPPLTAQLTVLRKAVLTELSKLATQLNLDFAGNEAVLLSSGLELAADPVAVPPPGAPALCEIEAGTHAGSMVLRTKRAPGSINTLWLFTTDPALPLGQREYRICADDTLVLTGLPTGQRLYACVAGLNGASTTENLAFAEARPRYVE